MSRESFKDATISGVRWTLVNRVVSEVCAFASILLLARLLSPAEFGNAAVALVFAPLAGILTFEGFASVLVQREQVEEAHCRVAMLTSLCGGVLLSALVAGLTPVLWRPLFGRETAHLILLISPVFLIASLGGVSRAIVWRRLDFRRMSLIDACAAVAGSVVPVALAVGGLGASAIVAGALVNTTVTTVLLLAAARPPAPRWHRHAQREIAGFGLAAALAGLVDVLFRNIDYAILATQWPAAQTGIYWRAFNVGVVYQGKLSSVMMQLAFPVYSRTESRAELRGLHERAARVHAAVIFPLLALLVVVAPLLIPYVLGAAWTPAVRPAQILAVAGMAAAVLTGYPQVMLAVGRPRSLLRFNVIILLGYGLLISVAAPAGVTAVAAAATAGYLCVLLGVYRFLLGPGVGIPVGRLAGELGPAVGACVALVISGELARQALSGAQGRALVLGLIACASMGAYALALRHLSPATWGDVQLLSRRVLAPLLDGGRSRRRVKAPCSPPPPVEVPASTDAPSSARAAV